MAMFIQFAESALSLASAVAFEVLEIPVPKKKKFHVYAKSGEVCL
jgi:hypothetical protein